MKIIKVRDYEAMSKKAAVIVSSQINMKNDCVLGLATGDTPLGMYKELIKMYKEEIIDFKEVTTFNLDEYYGISGENEQSYKYYMDKNFFNHINIKPENTHIPNGMAEDIEEEARRYDSLIQGMGDIDLQILGIGRNGHIGFNEPDVKFEACTHLVDLDDETIEANSRFFDDIEDVPKKAISMGIKNIMHADKIILIASGIEKADVIKETIEGSISPNVPASVLQLHPNTIFILDEAAASKLNI
ncbi:glucosamine-6-phosphate deaminase [Clostridium sp. D2Q-11]|uniref:Glucosamine-6-phosphate deaminase n=1 Tax=Anaeromonas frigoriresistens TaxID=2683708 RepID=A0A942UPH3_9FIRM|nr:glucosamine-6-phosphate deaminase [Anaeromonas frigoriresistens]MBS4536894.1 glucosamine-6-phosphate deaminase [Anaeromonas frigoriresistens]